MSMKSLALSAVAAIALVVAPTHSAADSLIPVKNNGYRFVTKQFEMKTVTVNVVTFPTRKEFVEAAKARGITNDNIAAFSILKAPYDTCTIYMVDPGTRFNPEMVGHEFLHCVYGQWHINNNKNK